MWLALGPGIATSRVGPLARPTVGPQTPNSETNLYLLLATAAFFAAVIYLFDVEFQRGPCTDFRLMSP